MELYALPCDGVMAHPLRRGLPILLQKCTQSNHSLRIPRCPHRGRSQTVRQQRFSINFQTTHMDSPFGAWLLHFQIYSFRTN